MTTTHVRTAVLDLTSAIHRWRENPSPEHMTRVIVAGDTLSGYALELERALILAIGETPETVVQYNEAERVRTLAAVCTCGHIGSFHVPHCLGVRGALACTCPAFQEPPPA